MVTQPVPSITVWTTVVVVQRGKNHTVVLAEVITLGCRTVLSLLLAAPLSCLELVGVKTLCHYFLLASVFPTDSRSTDHESDKVLKRLVRLSSCDYSVARWSPHPFALLEHDLDSVEDDQDHGHWGEHLVEEPGEKRRVDHPHEVGGDQPGPGNSPRGGNQGFPGARLVLTILAISHFEGLLREETLSPSVRHYT